MSLERRLGQYRSESASSMFYGLSLIPEISNLTAKFLIHALDSYFRTPVSFIISKLINFQNFFFLIIEDEPTEFPIYKTNQNDLVENNLSLDVNSIFTPRIEWPFKTIHDYQAAYLNQTLKPTQVAIRIFELTRKDEIQQYNAIIDCNFELTLKMAQESDNRYQDGKPLSPLDGIPFFSKEQIKIEGYSTYGGMYGVPGHASEKTSFCVQKLLNSGAVLMGTTSMPIMGSNPFGFNNSKTNFSAKNVWDTNRYAGGSSSGSAITVALGLCPFAIGTDSLGSIRIPSANAGIVGLKSTFGRVSNNDYTSYAATNAYMVIGPMTTCVSDAAIVYSIMAGPDPEFDLSLHQPVLNFKSKEIDLKSIKFAFSSDLISIAELKLCDAFYSVIEKLRKVGCSISDIPIPEINECYIACSVEMVLYLSQIFKNFKQDQNRSGLNDILLYIMDATAEYMPTDISNVAKQRSRCMKILEKIFEDVDIILCLSISNFSPEISSYHNGYGFFDQEKILHQTFYSMLASFTGIPAISFCIGYEENTGLPICIQLMTKWWQEDLLLSVSHMIESMFPLSKRPKDFQDLFH